MTRRSTGDRAARRAVLHRAPHEIDPLTWLAGNRLPLAFAVFVPLTAGLSIANASYTTTEVLGQLSAVALMSAACIIVHLFALPVRGPFTRTRALIPVTVAAIATVLSALNPAGPRGVGSLMEVESWWAPLGFAYVLGSLVPYTSVMTSLLLGAIAATVTALCSVFAFPESTWPTVTTISISLVPIVIATAGAIAFQWQVTARITRWAGSATPAVVSGRLLQERARLAAVRTELQAVSARVSEFLTDVADRADVSDADRDRAAALASEIRTELVERSNETWLQTVARGRPVTIIDLDQLADAMSEPQRATVHSLILSVLDSPEVQYPHVLIELRPDRDESTAVAITIDAGLAEGRRIMLLAPHYLSLRTAVDDLHWTGGETIRMRFRAQPGSP